MLKVNPFLFVIFLSVRVLGQPAYSSVATQDGEVYDANPTGDNCCATTMKVGADAASDHRRGFLFFDLGYDKNFTIDSVQLKLTGSSEINTTNRTIDVNQVIKDFTDECSWDSTGFDNVPWTTGGGDFGVQLASFSYTSPTTFRVKAAAGTAFAETVEAYIKRGRYIPLALVNNSELTINSEKSFHTWEAASAANYESLYAYGSPGGGGAQGPGDYHVTLTELTWLSQDSLSINLASKTKAVLGEAASADTNRLYFDLPIRQNVRFGATVLSIDTFAIYQDSSGTSSSFSGVFHFVAPKANFNFDSLSRPTTEADVDWKTYRYNGGSDSLAWTKQGGDYANITITSMAVTTTSPEWKYKVPLVDSTNKDDWYNLNRMAFNIRTTGFIMKRSSEGASQSRRRIFRSEDSGSNQPYVVIKTLFPDERQFFPGRYAKPRFDRCTPMEIKR